ncbi:MAG TPA: fused MFS/spermidine synthase, partial [Bacteroidales bacterium]|nr:fused MFS/spermidine synthase [Bacteroidales bacterium]
RLQLAIVVIILLSGASALINQIVWIRKFGLVFGVDVYTMGTVLSAFMAGLALGSLIFGRLVDKAHNPLKLFLLLEFGIGLFALLFPITFKWLIQAYIPVIQKLGISPDAGQYLKFAFSFLYLLIPTTLMGGTLPVILKYFVRQLRNLGWNVSNLYSVNNLGAVTGCFLAGFILIKYLGVMATLYTGAGINLFNALLALWVSKRVSLPSKENEPEKVTEEVTPVPSGMLSHGLLRLVLWVFVIEGFATLAYEVIWARVFIGYSCDKTTYFSSVIILSFIFGLSVGSLIIRRWIDNTRNLVNVLAITEILIGLTSFALMLLFSRYSLALNLKRSIYDTWANTMGKDYLVFFLILLIPTTLTGMVYPIVSKLYANNLHQLGKRMGTIGFLDTAGSILGSFAAGFLLIPAFGVIHSFISIVLLNILLGIVLILANPFLKLRLKAIFLSTTAIISVLLFLNTPDKQYSSWWDRNKVEIWKNFVESVPFYEEGPDATVTIREYNNYYALNVNGHNTAFTTIKDQIVNRMLGYIPYMLHPDPNKAMVIGFGLGFTVESLIQPEIDTVEVAEISQGVIKSGHVMNKWNNNVIDHPKVHMNLEDGRGYLMRTPATFDIITSNAIHPRLSNNIYTRDFYELCKRKLRKGGIMCQWATPNWITEREFKAQVKAFIEVFPYCQLWYLNEYSTILVGSEERITIDYSLVSQRFQNSKVLEDLNNIQMTDPFVFTSQYSMDKKDIEKYCKGAPVNTDDFPVVEFSTVVNIAPDTSALKFIAGHPVDYGQIIFADSLNSMAKEKLISDMQNISKARTYNILDIIANVKLQVMAFRMDKDAQQ